VSEDHARTAPRLTARGAATRERIVSAAADLMYLQGVGGTSLDEVIAASGTGKSQLYHYFDDKDALVRAVITRQVERVLAAQESHLPGLASLPDLEAWRDAIVGAVREREGAHGCPLGSLSVELADRSESSRAELVAGFAAWEGLLRAGLERMRASGELGPDADPGVLATGLLAALQGGLLLAQARRDAGPLQVALDMAVDGVRIHVRGAASPAA
jgi:TetR/AcrR family transcriptional repressor of nem operon